SRGSDLYVPTAAKAGPRSGMLLPSVLPAALVLTAAALQAAAVPCPVLGAGWAVPDAGQWPLELVQHLRRYPPRTRVFNELNLGGFVIYYAPELRVFI